MEEEREKVRQKLREKYNLEKPESVEEPEEESEESSSSEEEEEEEESIDEEKLARDAAREKIARKNRIFNLVVKLYLTLFRKNGYCGFLTSNWIVFCLFGCFLCTFKNQSICKQHEVCRNEDNEQRDKTHV